MSIGARSQSARTYLEKNVDEFSECKRHLQFLVILLILLMILILKQINLLKILIQLMMK